MVSPTNISPAGLPCSTHFHITYTGFYAVHTAALGYVSGGMGGAVGRGEGGYRIDGDWSGTALWNLVGKSLETGAEVRMGLLPQASPRELSVCVGAVSNDGVRVATIYQIGQVSGLR